MVAVLTTVVDQAAKIWLLFVFDLPAKVPVHVGPFIDLVLAWNTGISFSLLPQLGPLGQWALLAVKAVAVVLLWVWLAHGTSRLNPLALGLIVGAAGTARSARSSSGGGAPISAISPSPRHLVTPPSQRFTTSALVLS